MIIDENMFSKENVKEIFKSQEFLSSIVRIHLSPEEIVDILYDKSRRHLNRREMRHLTQCKDCIRLASDILAFKQSEYLGERDSKRDGKYHLIEFNERTTKRKCLRRDGVIIKPNCGGGLLLLERFLRKYGEPEDVIDMRTVPYIHRICLEAKPESKKH